LLGLSRQDWEDLSEDLFNDLFRYSAIKRAKLKGIKRNIAHIKKMRP
ncbi:MAG: tRNA epoxyqueuosine(34) reductase QueG, partial [Cytophagia bacterium]|nr:tRNA epoxyqueuosine(34) reductase QueG [Cytophagia bacterium]